MGQKVYSVITGATSGIGKALAYKLAKEGYNLIVIGRNADQLEELYKELTTEYAIHVMPYQMDISQREEVDAFGEWLGALQIGIELFINNAGIGSYGRFRKVSAKEDMAIIDTNISGFTYLLKLVSEFILKGGTILQVASTAAFAPGPYMSVYYASKSYVLSLSMAIREELKSEDIQVSILCPGPTKTAFQEKAKMQKADMAKKLAMEAEEVAEIAYRGMLKGKSIIVPGVANKVAVLGMSNMPLKLKTKLVAMTQKK
ncbi:MAG: SDR family NAD(P)-dependent oxidoreductase [Cellulosilyticaceae bacterium]